MAINLVVFPTVPNPVSGDWAKIVALVSKSFQNINDPLQVISTNIPQGATFQVGGAVYYGDSDTSISGTPSDYVKLTISGTTLVPSFVISLVGVTWNKIYNSYYDTSGNIYLFDEFQAYSSGGVSSLKTREGKLSRVIRGKADITISNYDNDSAPNVKDGSVFENRGKLIEMTSDATPTGYAGIAVSTTFYLYWDESAEVFIYSSTVPTWNDAYQGWYNGADRAFFSMYKDSDGVFYKRKTELLQTTNHTNIELAPLLLDRVKYSYNWELAVGATDAYSAIAVSSNHVAIHYYDGSVHRLGMLNWDGSNMTVIGNALSLGSGPGGGATLCRLSLDALVLCASSMGTPTSLLRAYVWSGTDWVVTGSDLATSAGYGTGCTYVSDGEIWASYNGPEVLRRYSWNGSVFTQKASIGISADFLNSIASVETNDDYEICVGKKNAGDDIRAYKYNISSGALELMSLGSFPLSLNSAMIGASKGGRFFIVIIQASGIVPLVHMVYDGVDFRGFNGVNTDLSDTVSSIYLNLSLLGDSTLLVAYDNGSAMIDLYDFTLENIARNN